MDYYLKIIYNYILVHVNSEDTNDILQETMLSVWQSLNNFENNSSFKTWVIGITRRKIADYYRKFYKSKNNVDICDYSDDLYSENHIDKLTDKIVVQNAVDTLSKIEKEIVYLVFNAQLTYKQIEQITGIPNGTIKSKMSLIKSKLKKQLEQGG